MAKKITKPEKTKTSGAAPLSNFRVPLALREFLEEYAEQDGRTYSGLAIKILTDWAKKNGMK